MKWSFLPQSKFWGLLVLGCVIGLIACQETSFDSNFDPRFYKETFASWNFSAATDYEFDPQFIEVGNGRASLKILDTEDKGSDFSSGTHLGTAYQNGVLKLVATTDSAATGASNSGIYTSKVFDLTTDGPWNGLQMKTTIPFYKELPGSSGSETASDYAGITSDLMAGLAGYWPLDETSMNGVSGADFEDKSSNNGHGVESGGVTFGASGKLGQAVSFDGVNDAITASVDLSSTSVITVAFWMKWDESFQGDTAILEYSTNFNAAGGGGFLINANPTGQGGAHRIAFGLKGNVGYNLSNIDRPNDGAWHHYVVVYNKSAPAATEVLPYVDGKLATYTKSHLLDNSNNFGNFNLYFMSRNAAAIFGKGSLDDVAVWTRSLSTAEILQLYRRGANRLKFQVRSCDDNNCVGEPWLGPDGTNSSYFSELQNNGSIDGTGTGIGVPKKESLALDFSLFPVAARPAAQRYFQYRVILESDDQNNACAGATCVPEVTSVNAAPTPRYYPGIPAIKSRVGVSFHQLLNISAQASVNCTPKYQISANGSDFYYWNGSAWTITNADFSHAQSIAEIQSHFSTFAALVGSGTFFFRAFLPAENFQACELSSFGVEYL